MKEIIKRRLPFVADSVLQKVKKVKAGVIKEFNTNVRACAIVPTMVGINIGVHNGKTYNKIFITEDMIGRKLGEFSPTRSFKAHGGDKNKERGAAAKKGGK